MKKLSLLLIGLLLTPSLLLTSCDRGDDPDGPIIVADAPFKLLKDYMVANSLDIDKVIKNSDGEKFVVGAPAADGLDAFLAKYYIIDIRSAEKFAEGHIEGAKNVAFGDILTEAANAGGKPMLIACYSGQTACYATALLRMYGFKHTQALKWGMSGWNEDTAGPWDAKKGANEADGHVNWSFSDAPTSIVFEDPSISSYLTNGSDILKERVEQAVAAGFGAATVSGADVLASPSNYFVNNYFSEADYAGFGHIANAYRILPLTLAGGEYLNLNPSSNAKVVTYCYTGQTSAVMTACLRVLGYDAYTLTYGMNGLYNTNPSWSTNQWGGDSDHKALPLIK